MKSKHAIHMLLTFLIGIQTGVFSQIYNVNYGNINFGGAGVVITPKEGTGLNAGNIVLYGNVVTIGGQQIDAIVRTQSITNGTYTDYDNISTQQNNLERWFSPRLNFNAGGGSLVVHFEFILGGSYDDLTDEGTSVVLQNVMVNSYDIDGNGNAGSNQYCDFGGFSLAEIGNPTNLVYSYDPNTSLTRFASTLAANAGDAADERNRVRCTYSTISSFTAILGGGGNGAAYYFLDFSGGTSFTSASSIEVPQLDLNTFTSGVDNDTVFIGDPVGFTKGTTNISYTPGQLDSLLIEFPTTIITDGSDEVLEINGSGGTTIPLNFTNGQVFSDFTIAAVQFGVRASVSGGRSYLSFRAAGGGTLSLSDFEMLLDSLNYSNNNSTPTVADRTFDVSVLVDEFESSVAVFTVEIPSNLPVELLYFDYACLEDEMTLNWSTASEYRSRTFEIYTSSGNGEWSFVTTLPAMGTTSSRSDYSAFIETKGLSTYYQLVQEDLDGSITKYPPISVDCSRKQDEFNIVPNPALNSVELWVSSSESDLVDVYCTGLQGQLQFIGEFQIESGDNRILIDLNELPPGIYQIVVEGVRTYHIEKLIKLPTL